MPHQFPKFNCYLQPASPTIVLQRGGEPQAGLRCWNLAHATLNTFYRSPYWHDGMGCPETKAYHEAQWYATQCQSSWKSRNVHATYRRMQPTKAGTVQFSETSTIQSRVDTTYIQSWLCHLESFGLCSLLAPRRICNVLH